MSRQTRTVLLFELGWWDVAEGTEQAVVVEPPHPSERGECDIFDPGPGTSGVDELSLVEPADRLSQGIVVTVLSAADGRLDAGQRQSLSTAIEVLGGFKGWSRRFEGELGWGRGSSGGRI